MFKREPAPNRNLLWASIVVDELARSGLRAVCIAPGSRSTPLTVAFAQHPGIKVYPHLDERSAAFFALGIALKTDQPVALVCTSGTALAEFFPAVIEAHESQVPLIILTGDRPPELRDSGANQTIDQVKLYGGYALWSVDMALPEADPDPLVIRYLRTTAARAYATANGLRKGVVHLNMPFRKPLEPVEVAGDVTDFPAARDDEREFTFIPWNFRLHSSAQVEALTRIVAHYERGLIVLGPYPDSGGQAVLQLGKQLSYPVLADPLSLMRFNYGSLVFGGYETFLNVAPPESPDVVIRFGQVPTSKWLNAYLEHARPKHFIQVSEGGAWADDLHQTTEMLQCNSTHLCQAVGEQVPSRAASTWLKHWQFLEAVTWQTLEVELAHGTDFDGAFVYDLIEALPAETRLFAGNSLPIRHVDQFGKPNDKAWTSVYANRGASGIDGNTSTALGIASQTSDPLVLLIGDTTFYHDMNGLLAVKNLDLKQRHDCADEQQRRRHLQPPADPPVRAAVHRSVHHAARSRFLARGAAVRTRFRQHGQPRRVPPTARREHRQRAAAHHRSADGHPARRAAPPRGHRRCQECTQCKIRSNSSRFPPLYAVERGLGGEVKTEAKRSKHMPDWQQVKTYEDITFDKADGMARIAFNRPEVRNAFRPKTIDEMIEAFKLAWMDPGDRRGTADRERSRQRWQVRLLRGRRPEGARRRRLRGRSRRRAAERARTPAHHPHHAQAGDRAGGGLRHRRRDTFCT